MSIKYLVNTAESIYTQFDKTVFIKWDGYRLRDKWTIVIDNVRLCDTDFPYERLNNYYYSLMTLRDNRDELSDKEIEELEKATDLMKGFRL